MSKVLKRAKNIAKVLKYVHTYIRTYVHAYIRTCAYGRTCEKTVNFRKNEKLTVFEKIDDFSENY
jgi:hypothetical protein